MRRKKTLTLDRERVEAAGQAVRSGRADSLSGWINQALSEKVARERRLRGLSAAIAAYNPSSGASPKPKWTPSGAQTVGTRSSFAAAVEDRAAGRLGRAA